MENFFIQPLKNLYIEKKTTKTTTISCLVCLHHEYQTTYVKYTKEKKKRKQQTWKYTLSIRFWYTVKNVRVQNSFILYLLQKMKKKKRKLLSQTISIEYINIFRLYFPTKVYVEYREHSHIRFFFYSFKK